MKTSAVLACLLLTGALNVLAADAQSEVAAAAKKLGDLGNYAWKTTTSVPDGAQFRPGAIEGKTEKGVSHVTMTGRENNKTEMVIKGDKSAVLTPEGEWQSAADLANTEGRGRMAAMTARNFQAPAAQAAQIVGWTKDLKKEGEVFTGKLTEEGVKSLITMRRGSGGGEGPAISNGAGTVKFWVKDGVLSKYEYHVSGSVTWNNNERQMDRTTTVEIMDAGKTKVQVPEAAQKKLS